MAMTLEQIRKRCGDCKKTHRWLEVRSDFDVTKYDTFRLVGIGTKKLRVISNRGTYFYVTPDEVRRCW